MTTTRGATFTAERAGDALATTTQPTNRLEVNSSGFKFREQDNDELFAAVDALRDAIIDQEGITVASKSVYGKSWRFVYIDDTETEHTIDLNKYEKDPNVSIELRSALLRTKQAFKKVFPRMRIAQGTKQMGLGATSKRIQYKTSRVTMFSGIDKDEPTIVQLPTSSEHFGVDGRVDQLIANAERYLDAAIVQVNDANDPRYNVLVRARDDVARLDKYAIYRMISLGNNGDVVVRINQAGKAVQDDILATEKGKKRAGRTFTEQESEYISKLALLACKSELEVRGHLAEIKSEIYSLPLEAYFIQRALGNNVSLEDYCDWTTTLREKIEGIHNRPAPAPQPRDDTPVEDDDYESVSSDDDSTRSATPASSETSQIDVDDDSDDESVSDENFYDAKESFETPNSAGFRPVSPSETSQIDVDDDSDDESINDDTFFDEEPAAVSAWFVNPFARQLKPSSKIQDV